MNILYIAYSCSPFHGSEDKIGWNIPVESAKTNNVFVITKEEQREYIDKFFEANEISNIQFYYVDIPATCKIVFRGPFYSGRLNIWNRRAYKLAEEICEEKQIDIIHQITLVEFRSIGDYGKIPNVKFVCGPIAGGQMVPKELKHYTKTYWYVESIRTIVNVWYRFLFRTGKKLRNVNYLLFANYETKDYLKSAYPANVPYCVITDIAIHQEDLKGMNVCQPADCKFMTLLVVGRLVYLKGHEFLFDALTRIPDYLGYTCKIVGEGAEQERLRSMCAKGNLKDKVVF